MLEKDLNVEGGFLETYKEFVTGLIKEVTSHEANAMW